MLVQNIQIILANIWINYRDASVYENLTGKSRDKCVFAGTLT